MFLQILLLLALYSITIHLFHKFKNHPPIPFPSLPFIGHFYLLLKKPLHRTLAKISAKHGRVLLLHFGSRPVLVISSASAAEECFTKNDVIFANRPLLLYGKHLGNNYTSLLWASYGQNWRNLRRISSLQLLSTNSLRLLYATRLDEVRLLLGKLFKDQDKTVVDLKSRLFELMLNLMMRMIAGKRYYGDDVTANEEVTRFGEIIRESFLLGGASNMGDYMPVMKWFGRTEKRMITLREKREPFIQELIDECRNNMKNEKKSSSPSEKKKNLIEVMLSLQEQEPESYKDETIRSLMIVLLLAGTDTSVGTLEWAMSFLLNHPQMLKKAQAEIDTVVGQSRLIDESDLPKLPYLHCIINETFRMKPVGPLFIHESSKECMVGGYRIPPRTMLLLNAWAIHNDPNNWEQPSKFKPERFEGLDPSNIAFKLIPFGSGRRGCPGEGLAMRMVGLTLGSLIQCFEWERIGEELVDLTEGPGLTMPKAQPLQAKCRPRQSFVPLLSQI